MTNAPQPITETELHAYVDGRLGTARRAEVEAWLSANPVERERIDAYRRQNQALHALFDPALDEAVPATLRVVTARRRLPAVLRIAAMAAWVLVGGILGWLLRGPEAPMPLATNVLAQQAALAHVVYTPEVLHPVEVRAEEESHLVGWLSKRLGREVRAPRLADSGYELVGGRLLPADNGPAAQFMYQDARGNRLTLYVRTDAGGNRETAFRYAQEGRVGVFYWVDGPLGYALSGEIDKPQLLRVADNIYRQLNP
ncbi:MAG: anti-sigma factor [Gammaproteobacteria bacterium]|nr:anti-sigma factor [Gammaproteobacteria bacterium]